jgi:deoxyribodipyrimidine photo-lyase
VTISSAKLGIFCFRHDLRLQDNPAFYRLCEQVDYLLCVYINEQDSFTRFDTELEHVNVGKLPVKSGNNRQRFVNQALQDLHQSLQDRGHSLFVAKGLFAVSLIDIAKQTNAAVIGCSWHPGTYEQQSWEQVKQALPSLIHVEDNAHTLFDSQALPIKISPFPPSFSAFRKKAEKQAIDPPDAEYGPDLYARSGGSAQPVAQGLPQSVSQLGNNSASLKEDSRPNQDWRLVLGHKLIPLPESELCLANNASNFVEPSLENSHFVGGQSAGLKQLNYYLFDSHLIKNYKQTRNGLMGWDYSSKLSPWLATGCISPKQVYQQLKGYESEFGANESTYWLFFELLWREYFQWYLVAHQTKVFAFSGIKHAAPNTRFDLSRFRQWCRGNTPYKSVNACMKQLNSTGYMSNRGRQWVASCFVHELGLDWRFGARYFEQQLIDFDVASNWANWQYLAGVGADPRGHRKFDLDKQQAIYDPEHAFTDLWG